MIERIIIENYKSIRKMDLRLEPINILIGGNGAGKSNFISFFELIKKVQDDEIEDFTLDMDGAGKLLHGGEKQSEYISGLVDFENANAYKFVLTPTRNYRTLRIKEVGDYWNEHNSPDKEYEKDWHWKPMNSPFRKQRDQYVIPYLNSFRVYHFHDTSKTAAIKQIRPLDDNRHLREDAGNLAAFLFLLKEKYPKHFLRIEMVVRSIAPFFDRFDLKPLERSASGDMIKLEWKEKGSDMYLDAHSLSDGTLRFMAIAALLMQPEPPKTIIIDEPELGLHPFAIHKLAGLLKKVSVHSQVIVSTQSVELVNQFDPQDIITVDREEGQSIFNRLEGNRLAGWLEEFSLGDIWQKNIIGGQP